MCMLLQCVCCSVFVAVCLLQCVYCSVLQCAAVCCSVARQESGVLREMCMLLQCVCCSVFVAV